MKKIIVGFGLSLSLVLMVTIAMAFGSKLDGSSRIRPESNCSFFAIPDLTAQQFSQIQAFRQALLKGIAPLQRDLLVKRAELNTYESNPNVDQIAVMAREKEIWQIAAKCREKIVNATVKATKLLTPEQNAQLPDFSSGVIGERGFNPIMCEMWGLGDSKSDIPAIGDASKRVGLK